MGVGGEGVERKGWLGPLAGLLWGFVGFGGGWLRRWRGGVGLLQGVLRRCKRCNEGNTPCNKGTGAAMKETRAALSLARLAGTQQALQEASHALQEALHGLQ
jgi:hypothetical protein